jgi:type IV secretion system protein VirB4
LGRLLDGDHERLGIASVQAFETEGLIGTAAAPAVLAYLFHRIEARLDGSATLVIVDEGWLALDDPTFGSQLREWLKTLRKKNASVVFARRASPTSTARRSRPPSSRAVSPASSSPTNARSNRRSPASTRSSGSTIVRSRSSRGRPPSATTTPRAAAETGLFELGLGPVALAFTAASSKADQAAIAEVLASSGRGGFAAAWLRRRGLPWAADLITTLEKETKP